MTVVINPVVAGGGSGGGGGGNTRTFWGVVANQAAMLALSSALAGDWCERADLGNQVWELTTAGYATLANWTNYPAGITAPVTVTATGNITRAAHANRIIWVDAVAVTLTIQPQTSELWVAGDTLEFISINQSMTQVSIADTLGHITPHYNPQIVFLGGRIKMRFEATGTGYWRMDTQTAMYVAGNTTKTTVITTPGSSTLNFNLNGGATDFNMGSGSLWWQTGNSGYTGAPVDCRVWIQSTVSSAPTAPQIAAGYGNSSKCQLLVQQSYYEGGLQPSIALSATPLSNIATYFPGSARTGEQLRMELQGHGLLIGSTSGNTYNGEWGEFDTSGNFLWKRAWGNTSEQRDIGTANFTISNSITNVVLAGSGTVVVMMPAAPVDGQLVNLSLETAYTAVSVTNNTGQTIVAGAAMTVTAGSFGTWRYRLAGLKWLRVA